MIKIVDKESYEILLKKLDLYTQMVEEYKSRCEIADNLIAHYDSYISELKAEVYKQSELVKGYKEDIKELKEKNKELRESADYYSEKLDWYKEMEAGESR